MILNITFGTDVANAPLEFKTAVAAVQQFFEATFTDPVTVNIQVDFGHLGHGLLGQSSYGLNTYSFSQITAAVMANSQSGDDGNAIVSLPATDRIPGTHHFVMTPAEAKALGLLGAATTLDGTATFSSTAPFDYDRSDGITTGQYDFQGSVAHEFSEIMGRELNAIGNEVQTGEANGYYLYDLFKFMAEGAAPSSAPRPAISRSTTAPPTSTISTTIRTMTSAIGRRARATTHFWPSAAPAW